MHLPWQRWRGHQQWGSSWRGVCVETVQAPCDPVRCQTCGMSPGPHTPLCPHTGVLQTILFMSLCRCLGDFSSTAWSAYYQLLQMYWWDGKAGILHNVAHVSQKCILYLPLHTTQGTRHRIYVPWDRHLTGMRIIQCPIVGINPGLPHYYYKCQYTSRETWDGLRLTYRIAPNLMLDPLLNQMPIWSRKTARNAWTNII